MMEAQHMEDTGLEYVEAFAWSKRRIGRCAILRPDARDHWRAHLSDVAHGYLLSPFPFTSPLVVAHTISSFLSSIFLFSRERRG